MITDGESLDMKRDTKALFGWSPEVLQSPVEALDMHLRHWEWMSTSDAVNVMAGFLDAYKGNHGSTSWDHVVGLSREVEGVLDQAQTLFVSPDVSNLLYHQGQAMPPDMLRATDVPYPTGFMVLADVWEYMDLDEDDYLNRRLPIRAIAWWEKSHVEQMTYDDPKDRYKPGILVALYADNAMVDIITPGARDTFYQGSPPGLFMVDLWAWTYDTWWKDVDPDQDTDQHHTSLHVGQMRRALLTAFRFMQEEIVRTERFRPPRPATRRWNRANISNIPEDGCITTLHLRRYAQKIGATDDEEREAREVCWSHRWWVNGHWRFNPKTGMKDIWVRPYIKGPDDAPLVLKERLVAVTR